MKKNSAAIVTGILFLFFTLNSRAQISVFDSVNNALKNSAQDSNRVKLLCRLSKLSDGDKVKEYAGSALDLSEKLGYISGLAQSHAMLGRYYYFKENFALSLLHFNMALKYARSIPDYRLAGMASLYIGFNNYENEPKISLDYYLQCIRYARMAGDKLMESYAYSAIGNLHEKWEDGKGALGYYILSLNIREKYGSTDEKISSLIETARAYGRMANYDKQLELVKKALAIAEKQGKDEQNLVYLYQMMGYDFADRQKDYKTALDYFLKSYQIVAKKNTFDYNNVTSLKPVADMYNKLGDYENASKYYKMYFDLMEAEKKKIDKELIRSQFLLKEEAEKQKLLVKDAEIMKQKMEIQKKQNLVNLAISGFAILLILVFFVYRQARLKQRSIVELDQKVRERTAELADSNAKLKTEVIEREAVQEKLRESELRLIEINKELEAFIYKASHDLKGPLASSKGLIHLAQSSENREELGQYLTMIDGSLDRLNGILQDLQELALIRQGKLIIKKVDVVKLINNVLPNFSAYENFKKIKFNINNQLTKDFLTDEILLNSILRNVLENSVKYSKKGIDDPIVNISLSEEGKYYKIKVSDNGIGISKEFHAKVFDVFFRANEVTRGSGLGLYIVKNAMNKLNGKVELADSELKKGTTIHLLFPEPELA